MSMSDWVPDPRYEAPFVMRSAIKTIWLAYSKPEGNERERAIDELDVTEEEICELFEALASYSSYSTATWVDPTGYHLSSCCESKWIHAGWYHECGSCDECCDCATCDDCGTRTRSVCEHCDCCSDHCSCAFCERCRAHIDSDDCCNDCSRCPNCCHCNGILRSVKEGRPWHAGLHERKSFRLRRLAGVEWEFNDASGDAVHIMEWSRKWRGGIHTDGSCGWEAVTAPIAGDHIAKCLTELGDAFEESSANANESCGIHVHVDARDFYWADMFRLMRIHSHLEPLLYVLAGQKRSRNKYCTPSRPHFTDVLDSADPKGAALSLAGSIHYQPESKRGREFGRNGINKKAEGRYRSLNIAPWLARQGKGKRMHDKFNSRVPDSTVEFRMHRNTLDARRVVGWVHLCIRIVEWACNASDAEAKTLTGMSALRALIRIAPESKRWILDRISAWRRATKPKRRLFAVRHGQWVRAA